MADAKDSNSFCLALALRGGRETVRVAPCGLEISHRALLTSVVQLISL